MILRVSYKYFVRTIDETGRSKEMSAMLKDVENSVPQGARVISAAQYPHENDGFLWTVLCEWEGKYVTWVANTQATGASHGHYFNNIKDAANDFDQRVEQHQN